MGRRQPSPRSRRGTPCALADTPTNGSRLAHRPRAKSRRARPYCAKGLGVKDGWALAALVALWGPRFLWSWQRPPVLIGLPSNDDWVYRRAADSLFRAGVIDMPGHTASAIGQIALVQPFLRLSGGQPWAFMAFGLTMASIGIASTYLLARRYIGMASGSICRPARPGLSRIASYIGDVHDRCARLRTRDALSPARGADAPR